MRESEKFDMTLLIERLPDNIISTGMFMNDGKFGTGDGQGKFDYSVSPLSVDISIKHPCDKYCRRYRIDLVDLVCAIITIDQERYPDPVMELEIPTKEDVEKHE